MTNFLLQHGQSILLGISGVYILVREVTSGKWRLSQEAINNYQAAIDSLNARMDTMQKDHTDEKRALDLKLSDLLKEVGRLTGIVTEKDKTIDMLQKIAENRSPQLEEILSRVIDLLSRIENQSKDNSRELKHQTVILEGGQPTL